MKNIKVFVSSPGDLRKERALVVGMIRGLNERPSIRDRYKFSPYLYEEHAPALAGTAAQQVVNEAMLEPRDADLVICMLWARMGTPLSEVNPDTGQVYQSGTEWEFYDAYRAYQRRRTPVLLLYRCAALPPPDADPQQVGAVAAFFRRFEGADAPLRGLYRTFSDEAQLRDALTNDLDSQIARWDRAAARARLFPIAVTALLLVMALFAVFLLVRGQGIALENAPFNVAIAGFALQPGSDIAVEDVQVLSQALYVNFTQRLEEVRADLPLVVGVWSPEQVGSISGATAEEREANAQRLVEQLQSRYNARADIVVYGIVERQGERILVTPEFYVTQKWPELSEMFGRFGLAAAVYTRNIDQTRALSGDLSNRSQVLASVTQGLVQMIFRQFDDARRAFDAALAINQSVVGRDMLYVLRGNSAIGNYNRIVGEGDAREAARLPVLVRMAGDDFRAAIAQNPDYSRGYSGLGMVGYLEVLEDVRRTRALNVPGERLAAIEVTLNRALTAADNPPSADTASRVAFGLAQVALLRVLGGDMRAAETARAQFGEVVAAYADGENPRIAELAAEAHARLGLLAYTIGDYETARTEYEIALNRTELDEREALYRRRLLEATIAIERGSGNVDAASEAYDALLASGMLPDERVYALYTYARMLSEAGRAADALMQLEAAAQVDPAGFPALGAAVLVDLGNAYDLAGRRLDAVKMFERALALDPIGQAHLAPMITPMRGTDDDDN